MPIIIVEMPMIVRGCILGLRKHHMEVCNVTAGVQFSEIDNCTDRCIFVYTLIFICLKVRAKGKNCCNYNKPTNYYRCEIIPQCYCDNKRNMNFKNDYVKEKEQYSNSSYYDYNEIEIQGEPSDF